MQGAFWILIFTVIVGIVLYMFELRWRRNHNKELSESAISESTIDDENAEIVSESASDSAEAQGQCCGLHLVCEKDSLSPMSDEILYYDDEELDRFIGREEDSYSPDEIEEFRDILMTLRPEDVSGWARSITRRHLTLPTEIRDELLMLVNEQRNAI